MSRDSASSSPSAHATGRPVPRGWLAILLALWCLWVAALAWLGRHEWFSARKPVQPPASTLNSGVALR